ncbi:hypothetical protein BC629DRAFT_1595522 [Irpex lacteus]|nr:hypothetical protein BC629DRAFT_1595522 [Irpex lacteus]
MAAAVKRSLSAVSSREQNNPMRSAVSSVRLVVCTFLCTNVRTIVAEGNAVIPLLPLLATRNLSSWTFDTPLPEPRIPVFPNLKCLRLDVTGFASDEVDYGVRLCLLQPRSPRTRKDAGYRGHTVNTIIRYFEVVRDCLASRAECQHLVRRKLGHLSIMLHMLDPSVNPDCQMYGAVFAEFLRAGHRVFASVMEEKKAGDPEETVDKNG